MALSKTETFEFSVQGVPRLLVRDFAGDVRLRAGQSGQVLVRVTKKARGLLGSADEGDLEQIRVEVAQRGDTISIEAELHRHLSLGGSLSADIEVTAPLQAQVDLRLNAGNAEIEDISGPVKAKVNAGNLDLRGGRLEERSELECNAGNLTIAAALAPHATLDTGVNAGNVRLRLPHSTAVHFDARTHAGTIDVSGFPVTITRRFSQQTASGALGENPQGMVTVRVDAGNITLDAAG
jgi:hypothetical protein